MSNVNKVKLSSEGTSGVPAVIFLLGGPVPKTNVASYVTPHITAVNVSIGRPGKARVSGELAKFAAHFTGAVEREAAQQQQQQQQQ